MRLINMPTAWTILSDFVAWFMIQLAAAFIAYRIPDRHFARDRGIYRTRRWEKDGKFWQNAFRVKKWKKWLPDGAQIAGRGFVKKKLRSATPDNLERFVLESRRAELTHDIAIPPSLLFFLWNPWPVGLFMVFYAILANAPCLVAQRYNRPRFQKILKMQKQQIQGV
jgi:glycosyl-4,4'-diaponeurosporenoate acyltransferase